MWAARWKAPRTIALERLPMPQPRDDEALIRVTYTGLCGSDLEEYVEGPVVIRGEVTLGHEIIGRVERPARDGSGPPVGTRVVVDVVTGCGRCHWCFHHDEGLCPDLVVTGQHIDGGLAEYVVGRASRLIPIPDHVSDLDAVLAEPLSVAVRALRKVGPLLGRGVLVIGGGTVGMLVAQVARAGGAGRVAVVEPVDERRALIESWGITSVWASSASERRDLVDRLFPERGADIVAECSGRPGMSKEAVERTGRGGTTILLGVVPDGEEMNLLDVVLAEKTVRGSAAHMWDDDVAAAVDLIASGAVSLGGMVTHEESLHDAPRAFQTLLDSPREVVKMVVRSEPSAAESVTTGPL